MYPRRAGLLAVRGWRGGRERGEESGRLLLDGAALGGVQACQAEHGRAEARVGAQGRLVREQEVPVQEVERAGALAGALPPIMRAEMRSRYRAGFRMASESSVR